MEKFMNNRKVTLSYIAVSALITLIFALLFANSLFYTNRDLYAFDDYSFLTDASNERYSELEVKEIRKYVQVSGYTISGSNEFTSTNDDPNIQYSFDKQSVNTVKVLLAEPAKENMNVTLYLSSNGTFSENNTISSTLIQGDKELVLSFPKSELVSVRVDIGGRTDLQFNVDKIVIGHDYIDFVSFRSIVLLEVVFFTCFFLCYLLKEKRNNKLNKVVESYFLPILRLYKFNDESLLKPSKCNWKKYAILCVFIVPFCILLSSNTFLFKLLGFSEGISFDSIISMFESLDWRVLLLQVFMFISVSAIIYQKRVCVFRNLFKYRYLIGILIIVVAVVFEISGSSIASWHDYSLVPQEEAPNILFGLPRAIRSDEWAVSTPMAISQTMNNQGTFQYFSDIIRGMETDVFMVYGQPVMDPVVLFRPFTIGYLFLGASRGLSFFWVSRFVFLFLITFDFFRVIITKGNKKISLIAAFMISFMPLIQWWFAINGLVEMFVFGQLAILCVDRYMCDDRIKTRILCVSTFFLCAGCYFMTLYPAQMIPLFYVFLAITISVLIKNRKVFKFNAKVDILVLLIPFMVFCFLMGRILLNSFDTIQAVMNTAYPGNRVVNEGNRLSELFTYGSNLFLPYTDKNLIGNSSEMSRGFDLFPLGIIFSLIYYCKFRKNDYILTATLVVSVFLAWYCSGLMPSLITSITLFNYSTMTRALIALNLCNIILLMRSVCIMDVKFSILQKSLIIWPLLLIIMYFNIRSFGDYFSQTMILITMLILFICYWLFFSLIDHKRHLNLAMSFMIMIMIIVGFPVNPINKGMDFLLENPLLTSINEIVENDNEGLWIMEGKGMFNNTTIMAGAPTINSTNTYPAIDRWKSLDNGKNEDLYNRYAHIYINLVDNETAFTLENSDSFIVDLNIEDLKVLNVKYILSKNELNGLNKENVQVNMIKKIADFKIYEVIYI